MRWQNDNMLVRIAQGDAYAIAYEYVDDLHLKNELLKFEKFHQHPTYLKLKPGQYSDDTQMSLAVAETILGHHLVHEVNRLNYVGPTAQDFSNSFYECFKRDERDGYSRGFQTILEKAKSVHELQTLIVPNSNKNGAAMRSVPLGVISDPHKLISIAALQAQVTHATWGGINSSIAVALMSHYALYDRRSFASMYDWCVRWLPSFAHFERPWEGQVKAKNDKKNLGIGMITAHAVFTLLTTKTSLIDIMRQTIEWGGDTDSVAAIAWGIASARMKDDLPTFFVDQLEIDGTYGVSYLQSLGKQLMNSKL